MIVVDNDFNARTLSSCTSSTPSNAPRSAGDSSDPWLQTACRALAGVGLGISTSLLIMRIYTKARIMRKFWWDDILIIVAWVFSVISQSLLLYGYAYSGYGVHVENLSRSQLETYPKTLLAVSTIYIMCLACAKLALLMFYYSLLNLMQFWKYVIYVVSGIIAAYTIAIFLAFIFACRPIGKGWDPTPEIPHTGYCINRLGLYLATAITNTVSDIILILIPVPIVWRLHLPVAQKLGVAAMFGVGSLTVITTIVRLATIYPLVSSNDQPYQMALASLLTIIEGNFVIICGCLPYLRQFLRRHAPRLMGDVSNPSSSDTRQSKRGVLRCLRMHTPDSETPEQSQEMPPINQEDPHYGV